MKQTKKSNMKKQLHNTSKLTKSAAESMQAKVKILVKAKLRLEGALARIDPRALQFLLQTAQRVGETHMLPGQSLQVLCAVGTEPVQGGEEHVVLQLEVGLQRHPQPLQGLVASRGIAPSQRHSNLREARA